MSQENVDIVRRMNKAFDAREVEALFEFIDPDIVLDWSRSIGPSPAVYHGREGMLKFLRSWWDAFEMSAFEVDEVIDAGEQVIVLGHGEIKGRDSGVEVSGAGAALVWSFSEGTAISCTLYQRRAEALHAVGLSD